MRELLTYLVEASVGLGVTWVFYRGCLARLTFFSENRVFLLSLTLLSTVLPLGTVSVHSATDLDIVNTLSYQQFPWWSNLVFEKGIETTAFSWQNVLVGLYLGGVCILAAQLLFQLLAVRRIIRKSERHKKKGYTLVYSDGSLSMASFFHFIFLRKGALTGQEQEFVIQHELVHARQGHTWDLLFFRVINVIFWFNPFVYWLTKSAKEVHEYLADQGAVQTRSTGEYAQLMLRLATPRVTTTVVHHFYHVHLKRRIIMLHQLKSNPMKKVVFVLAVPLVALMLMFFSVKHAASPHDQLIGTWKGMDFNFKQLKGPEVDQAMIAGGQELHESGTFVVNEDQTYEYRVNGTMNGQGTWRVEERTLITEDDSGEVIKYQIVSLDDHTLVTTHKNQAETPDGAINVAITLTYERE